MDRLGTTLHRKNRGVDVRCESLPPRMHIVVHRVLRPECVHPGTHSRAIIVELVVKGCEGEVKVEETYALLEMLRVRIYARS